VGQRHPSFQGRPVTEGLSEVERRQGAAGQEEGVGRLALTEPGELPEGEPYRAAGREQDRDGEQGASSWGHQ
jgi:hypothetical protein